MEFNGEKMRVFILMISLLFLLNSSWSEERKHQKTVKHDFTKAAEKYLLKSVEAYKAGKPQIGFLYRRMATR